MSSFEIRNIKVYGTRTQLGDDPKMANLFHT